MKNLYRRGDLITPQYQVIGILGQGGTAITYAVADRKNERQVAIKMLSLKQANDWKVVEMFAREAKALANLQHLQIPQYIDYFEIDTEKDKRFCLVQELIEGDSLAHLVEKGWDFSEAEVKLIAEEVLNILNYLHSLNPNVIHRDLKPQNIIRTDEGKIYLVDFGAVQDVYRNTITKGGTFVGTIDYMPPEQLRGEVNYSSDLYSLGCTLLYLLTGRSPLELPIKKMKLDFHSAVSISPPFTYWIDTLIEPMTEARFASTTEALSQLKQLNKPQSEDFLQNQQFLKAFYIDIEDDGYQLTIDIQRSKKALYVNLALTVALSLIVKTGDNNRVILVDILGKLFVFIKDNFPSSLLILVLIIFLYLFIMDSLIADRQYLIINRDRFCLKFSSWFSRKVIAGNTADLRKIEVTKEKLKPSYSNKSKCVLWEGIRPHIFALNLTAQQQKILVTEIIRFLESHHLKNFS